MKRCPQCNPVETDEALKFCRVDGATLVSDSSSVGAVAGTAQPGSSADVSEVHTALGDKDQAFAELEKSYRNRDWFRQRLKVDPFMDSLRDDPRFAEMVKRIGLP